MTIALVVSLEPSGPGVGIDPGNPSGFVLLFVLIALVGIGLAVSRIWWSGQLARRRANDPSEARVTAMLAGDAGTAAAFIGRERDPGAASGAPDERSITERLDELAELRRLGLITPTEAVEQRAEILRDL